MDRVLGHVKWTVALVYLDYIVTYATTFHTHLRRFTFLLDALYQANLPIKAKKYFLWVQESPLYRT